MLPQSLIHMYYYTLAPFLLALLAVCWIHPRLVRIALLKNIVDNPDARKLQRIPIPVLGGVAVFFGAVIGIAFTSVFVDCSSLLTIVAAMMVMLYTGTMDDILDLSPSLRFLIEIAIVTLLIAVTGHSIDHFHGFWGLQSISEWIAWPLTIFATVGIINAINLIDGVDGLSSGYCVMASFIFGTVFFLAGDISMVILAAVSAGALIPFFFHNVFGKSSKMFIGDGGTLVMGIVLSSFVLHTLSNDSAVANYVNENFGLIPFTLAVLSVPVFDTLRVMTARIIRGTSPFHPDKTHLHHLFIELGFSHAGTTVSILSLNCLVVLVQWMLYELGYSIDVQLYAVVLMGLLVTSVFYYGMKRISPDGWIKRLSSTLARMSHIERQGAFLLMQKFVDKI